MLSHKKDVAAHTEYVEEHLHTYWWTMSHLLYGLMSNLFRVSGNLEKAVMFHDIHRKLLEIFDAGGDDFYAEYKIQECEEAAQIYMKLSDKKACLKELRRLVELCKKVETVAASKSFNIAKRNLCFADIEAVEILEEFLLQINPKKALEKCALFFGDDPDFAAFMAKIPIS